MEEHRHCRWCEKPISIICGQKYCGKSCADSATTFRVALIGAGCGLYALLFIIAAVLIAA